MRTHSARCPCEMRGPPLATPTNCNAALLRRAGSRLGQYVASAPSTAMTAPATTNTHSNHRAPRSSSQRRQAPCATSIAELAWTAARNATFDPLDAPDPLRHKLPALADFNWLFACNSQATPASQSLRLTNPSCSEMHFSPRRVAMRPPGCITHSSRPSPAATASTQDSNTRSASPATPCKI